MNIFTTTALLQLLELQLKVKIIINDMHFYISAMEKETDR